MVIAPELSRALEHLNEPFFKKYYLKNAVTSFGGRDCKYLFKYPSIQVIAAHVKSDLSYFHWMIMQMHKSSDAALAALFLIALEHRWSDLHFIPLSLQTKALTWMSEYGPNNNQDNGIDK